MRPSLAVSSRLITVAAVAAVPFVAGCGGGGDDDPRDRPAADPKQRAYEQQIALASDVTAADFAKPDGRTLDELGQTAQPGPVLGLATSVFEPGTNRLAFGMLTEDNKLLYGKSAVYVARRRGGRARGPYPAPADPMVTEPRFRSRQGASVSDRTAAIYDARVPFPRRGRYSLLVLTQTNDGTVGALGDVRVRRDSAVPEPGERPPAVETDTVASAGGDIAKIDTRIPPAKELHEVSFDEVLGKRPVALVFATPQLCMSRTCGPVVDMTLQMRAKYGDQMQFIHQEVYVDNQVDKGLRRPLRQFNLPSEPWLFTVDREGRVAARLEGAFGLRAYEEAVQEALR